MTQGLFEAARGLAGSDPLSHVLQHPIKVIEAHLPGPLAPNGVITLLSNQMVTMLVAALLLLIFVPIFVRKRRDTTETGKLVPAGFGNFFEAVCTYLRDDVAKPALGPYTDKFIKFIWTIFFFVLTMNLLGLLPIGAIAELFSKNGILPKDLHLGGTPTTNIYVTGTLAIITFVMMVFNGLRYGGKAYLAHFAPGPNIVIKAAMVPLEIISTVAKVFALALRLFAANTAGHILLAVLVSLAVLAVQSLGLGFGLPLAVVIVIGSVAISLVEIFVAFLQAFIFTFLTALFIGMSVNLHHDDHGHEGHGHDAHPAKAH